MTVYKVILPVCIDGQIHQFGDTVEVDLATAEDYAHALMAIPAPAPTLTQEQEPDEHASSNS